MIINPATIFTAMDKNHKIVSQKLRQSIALIDSSGNIDVWKNLGWATRLIVIGIWPQRSPVNNVIIIIHAIMNITMGAIFYFSTIYIYFDKCARCS